MNTASLAAIVASPVSGAYSLSNDAVVNFTRTVAAEVERHGVRANVVCPGYDETPVVTSDRIEEEWSAISERMPEEYPSGVSDVPRTLPRRRRSSLPTT